MFGRYLFPATVSVMSVSANFSRFTAEYIACDCCHWPREHTSLLLSYIYTLHCTLCRRRHHASEVWIAFFLDTLSQLHHTCMHPGVKSAVWRSDAIPQVGLDTKPLVTFSKWLWHDKHLSLTSPGHTGDWMNVVPKLALNGYTVHLDILAEINLDCLVNP
jgi:hypothetical protein